MAMYLKEIIPAATNCLVIGDFNLCIKKFLNHEVFKTLKDLGFSSLVSEATHFDGGHLDQAWLRNKDKNQNHFDLSLYSPYYNCKDHDSLLFSFFDPGTNEGNTPG